jgi:hypothetical protein
VGSSAAATATATKIAAKAQAAALESRLLSSEAHAVAREAIKAEMAEKEAAAADKTQALAEADGDVIFVSDIEEEDAMWRRRWVDAEVHRHRREGGGRRKGGGGVSVWRGG